LEAKLYSPVFVDLWEYDYNEGNVKNELSQHEAVEYADEIRDAMKSYAEPGQTKRGLMEYYNEVDSVDEKVQSLFLDVEIHDGRLWTVAALDLTEPLDLPELIELCGYITGQYSDGWGEAFEQQDIKVEGGDLNVHLWRSGDEFFIDTQKQFADRLGIRLPPDALSETADSLFNPPDTEPSPLTFADLGRELTRNGESSTELALLAVNGLIIFAAETTAQNYKTDRDSDWAEKVSAAQKITGEIIHFTALDERMPVIDFFNEFENQEENAREYPDQIFEPSPEQKEAGLRGLAWYACEMLTTLGLENENKVTDVQSMMAAFAAQWETLQPLYERLNNGIQAEISELRTAALNFVPEDFDQVVEAAVVAEVDAEIFTELRQRLIDRAQQNWDVFRNTPLVTTPEDIYHRAIRVVARRDANIFINDYKDFTAEQVNCLLLFANPVDLVAGYLDPKSDIEEMPGILASIRDDLENLKQHYALAPDPSAPTLDELVQRLRDRLDDNYEVYMTDTMDLSKTEIFKLAGDIANTQNAYEYFTEDHVYSESEVSFLLKFQFPLQVLSDGWQNRLPVDEERIEGIFDSQEYTLKSGYELMPDEPDPVPAASVPLKVTDAASEKPSVMDRIRQAALEAKERSATSKDTPDRKKSGPEL